MLTKIFFIIVVVCIFCMAMIFACFGLYFFKYTTKFQEEKLTPTKIFKFVFLCIAVPVLVVVSALSELPKLIIPQAIKNKLSTPRKIGGQG